MNKKIFFFAIMLILSQFAIVRAQMTVYTYNFNNLNLGDLNGQDNWTSVINSNTSVTFDFSVGYNEGTGSTTPDNSLGIFYNHSGGNYGRTASRTTTTDFPFNFSIGGIMGIEVEINTAWWGTFFGFGYDVNNNGYIVPGIEQSIAFETNEGGFGIFLTQQNANNTVFMKPDGTKIKIEYDSIAGWNRWRFFIDFDANSGAGAVSLFAKKPNGNWKNISTVQNLNLGLTPGSNDKKDPAKWTKLFVQALGSYSAFDNIVIQQPNTGGLQYQYITFVNSPNNHLATDAPFVVHAVSSKGLPVNCTITGPATLAGDTLVTLTGGTGTVSITAHQPGNTTVAPAQDVTVTFDVIDPLSVSPQIDIKNPVDGNIVRSPHLNAIPISVSTSIDHSELLSISQVYFNINSQNINAKPTNNGYYIAYWTPPAFGTYTLNATAVSSGGVSTSKNISFQVIADSSDISYKIVDNLHFAIINNSTIDTTLIFPSFTGTFSKITAYVKYECPTDGCEPWDVIAHVNIRGANGDWIELLRYITPYATTCGDSIDITDFASQLQGKIDVYVNFPAKSVVTITLNYKQGFPTYKYTWMEKLWFKSYYFGTWSTGGVPIQPVEVKQLKLSDTSIKAAYVRVMTTGHGGPNNTGNAAEFYNATHNFKINGSIAFTQNLWRTCNPNPTGCMPQSGTWQYNRAGWCPGSIPMLWRYDVSSRIGSDVNLMYEFAPNYVDMCSSQNPNCVSGVTCTDCLNTENPNLLVAGELITYYGGTPSDLSTGDLTNLFDISLYPNPSNGIFNLISGKIFNEEINLEIYNISGVLINKSTWDGNNTQINIKDFPKGIYFLKISASNSIEYKKLIVN